MTVQSQSQGINPTSNMPGMQPGTNPL